MAEFKKIAQLWKMSELKIPLTALLLLNIIILFAQTPKSKTATSAIIPGASRMEVYLPLLKGKKVAIFANQTSTVGNTHLVDTLIKSGIKVVKIFGPEHGFRGDADAGEKVIDGRDMKSGLQVISLYGNHKKPTAQDFDGIDVLVFDIQDVGVRFYTYIASLEYFMEAALENHKPLLILDRPNPNGFYVDGPVLDMKYQSFIGMHPIPIVYGMTIGEYSLMLTGEKWLSEKANTINSYNTTAISTADTPFHLMVIKCSNYDHTSKYVLPVMPSPNLKSMQAIYLYPSTCLFEGTIFSEGRGTDTPFEVYGHPLMPKYLYSFTPRPNAGAKTSKCFYKTCYGYNLHDSQERVLKKLSGKIQLKYLLDAYSIFPGKDSFFLANNFIDKLAGSSAIQKQVRTQKTETAIRQSWEPGLSDFKKMRKKYLLYPDFK